MIRRFVDINYARGIAFPECCAVCLQILFIRQVVIIAFLNVIFTLGDFIFVMNLLVYLRELSFNMCVFLI